MGHSISRHPSTARRYGGTASGQVTFSPLWQPTPLLARIRRHSMFTLEQPVRAHMRELRVRPVKRIFRTGTFVQL